MSFDVTLSNAVFVMIELAMKIASVSEWWFCRHDIAEVSNIFETPAILRRQTLLLVYTCASSTTKSASKIAYVNGPLGTLTFILFQFINNKPIILCYFEKHEHFD